MLPLGANLPLAVLKLVFFPLVSGRLRLSAFLSEMRTRCFLGTLKFKAFIY